MLSQEEDNRKKILITEMSNINSGKAEDDCIKILVLFREKDLMRGSLERTKTEMKLQVVFRDLFICFTKETVFLFRLCCTLYFPFHVSRLWLFKLY